VKSVGIAAGDNFMRVLVLLAIDINVTVLEDVAPGTLVDKNISVECTCYPEDGGSMFLLTFRVLIQNIPTLHS
jgi:hypothetical protein